MDSLLKGGEHIKYPVTQHITFLSDGITIRQYLVNPGSTETVERTEIHSERDDNKLFNPISKWLDTLLPDDAPPYIRTYFIPYSKNNMWGFRYPGSTRGHINLNEEGIITSIKFYTHASIYDEERALKEFERFIGMYPLDVHPIE